MKDAFSMFSEWSIEKSGYGTIESNNVTLNILTPFTQETALTSLFLYFITRNPILTV